MIPILQPILAGLTIYVFLRILNNPSSFPVFPKNKLFQLRWSDDDSLITHPDPSKLYRIFVDDVDNLDLCEVDGLFHYISSKTQLLDPSLKKEYYPKEQLNKFL